MAEFPGESNRSRCLAHIVNLVVKIILRQFDVTKKKVKRNVPGDNPDLTMDSNADEDQHDMIPGDEDAVDEMERVLDKEEKEMDDGDEDDDEDGETLERDIEMVEEALEEEIKEVSKLVKPVRQVLYKVGPLYFLSSLHAICPPSPLYLLSSSHTVTIFPSSPRHSLCSKAAISPIFFSPFVSPSLDFLAYYLFNYYLYLFNGRLFFFSFCLLNDCLPSPFLGLLTVSLFFFSLFSCLLNDRLSLLLFMGL